MIQLSEIKFPDEANKTNHPQYCAYHRGINHPTRDCYVLKDKLQALTEVRVLRVYKDKKKVNTAYNAETLEKVSNPEAGEN